MQNYAVMQDDGDDFFEFKNHIQDRIYNAARAAGITDGHVVYSAYKIVDGQYVDNLNDTMARGPVILTAQYDWSDADGDFTEKFKSEVMTDPTWLDVAVWAYAVGRLTRDKTHFFLESAKYTGRTERGARVYELSFGS
jgi:hypothetical protein